MRIYSDEYVESGRRLDIELFLPSGTTVEAIVRVVWIKKLPHDASASYDVGLEFVRLSASDEQRISAILRHAQS